MKYIYKLVCVALFILTSPRVLAIEDYPLLVPAGINGIGYFLGAGYGAKDIFDTGSFAALGYVGDMQGVSLSANDWLLVHDWFSLDGRMVYLNTFTPLNNYHRVSETSEFTFKPSLTLTTVEISFNTRYEGFSFRLSPGINLATFKSFLDKNGNPIHIDSMHITDLKQSYGTFDLGYRQDFSQQKQHYIEVNLRYIRQGQSSGYSGSNIISSTVSGQYNLFGNIALFGQVFMSDATAIKNEIQGASKVAQTLDMHCNDSNEQCRQLQAGLISYITANNAFGTAEPIGGPERMKAYPVNYFRAAHVGYMTAELRFSNFDEKVDRNVFLHLFDELAAVNDDKDKLQDNLVRSTGVEFGLVVNDSYVYKLTAARGSLGWTGHLTLARSW